MCQVGYQVEYSSSSSSSPAAATYVTAQRLLTWPSHATSVKIPPPFVHISFKSKLELLLASKQASMFASLKLRFDLSWGGEIVNTDFPVVFYRATAALYHWPSNTIVLYSRLFLLALVLIPIQSLVPCPCIY